MTLGFTGAAGVTCDSTVAASETVDFIGAASVVFDFTDWITEVVACAVFNETLSNRLEFISTVIGFSCSFLSLFDSKCTGSFSSFFKVSFPIFNASCSGSFSLVTRSRLE